MRPIDCGVLHRPFHVPDRRRSNQAIYDETEYYGGGEMSEALSDCCGAPAWGNTDLCSECKEHADFLTDEEFEEMGNNNLDGLPHKVLHCV